MTTRIDRRFAALKQEGRAALVTFTMAGDPDYDTSLAIIKALPAAGADVIETRHAVHRSDGRRPGDPGGRRARAQGRAEHDADARAGARIPPGRRRDADRADGLLQSDLHLRRRPLPRRRARRRRRRADRRGPAARGGRASSACRRSRPASTSSALRRRRPTTSGCRRCSPTPRASSTTSRSPASPARRRPTTRGSPRRSRASSGTPSCRSRSASACAPPSRRPQIARGADGVVVGSALVERVRGSLDPDGKATARTVAAVTELVGELAGGVRAARRQAAE